MSGGVPQYDNNYLGSGIRCHGPLGGGGQGSEVKCDARSFRDRFQSKEGQKPEDLKSEISKRDVGLGVGIPAAAGVGMGLMPALGILKKLLKF